MSIAADLGSAASSLEQLVERVSEAADAMAGSGDDDLSIGLMDVERSLRAASRRLERVLRDMASR